MAKTKKKLASKGSGKGGRPSGKGGKPSGKGAAGRSRVAGNDAGAPKNPYEVFQNRGRRHNVLGEKVRGGKRDVAKSRAAALVDRAQGLLAESLTEGRRSQFVDARLGEQGGSSSGVDERTARRLIKLRQKQIKKSFSLDGRGAEDLTHGGKALSSLRDDDLKAIDEWGEESDDGILGDPDDPITIGKIRKAEEKKERVEHERRLGDFDEDFGALMGELAFKPSKLEALQNRSKERPAREAPDDYDRSIKQLAFERRAAASERLQTPEELERAQGDKLRELEAARLARTEAAELPPVADPDHEERDTGKVEAGEADGSSDGDEGDGAEAEESEEEQEEGESEDEGEDEDAVGSDDEDDLQASAGCLPLLSATEVACVDIMANGAGNEELPYALECPTTAKAVASLLEGRSALTALKLVQRIRACTAAALHVGNKEKLKNFFIALLDHVLAAVSRADGDISSRGLELLYALRPALVDFAGLYPDEACGYFCAKLQTIGVNTLPRAAEVSCLKLITLLFPSSDFQHRVVSPAALLADHWASRLAGLGAGIADLVSDALLLWGVLHEFVIKADRFCASFFHLGRAILESCWASSSRGRPGASETAADVAALLAKAAEHLAGVDAAAARIVLDELLDSVLANSVLPISSGKLSGAAETAARKAQELQASTLRAALDHVRETTQSAHGVNGGLAPLRLFAVAPPQIKMLDPIFHDPEDGPASKNADLTDRQKLQRQLKTERRATTRQLKRDAGAMQQLQGRKDKVERTGKLQERKRVRSMMEAEGNMLRKMATEGGGMDTSLASYKAGKAKKKENPRMGGNATAGSEKAPRKTELGAGGNPIKKTKRGEGIRG